ncbi:hypothetical protein [Flavihumibacter sp.]|jgi:hypothetical protein|uniref:hypothetical protein n=1 Tax=Flavihumibacter sp. TaxID=1913981 RepID=UPI002FC81CD2|nr:hypothetical protein [Flavihumibacter sediminis]
MLRNLHTRIARHSLKLFVATAFLGFACFAFASMGGEKKNRKGSKLTADFVPIKTSSGFTLKAGPSYKGSMIFKQEKSASHLTFNTLITYQKGNTTYIMPYNHRVTISKSGAAQDNLQLLRLKVKLNK